MNWWQLNRKTRRHSGSYNSWANLRCSGCAPLVDKSLWNGIIGINEKMFNIIDAMYDGCTAGQPIRVKCTHYAANVVQQVTKWYCIQILLTLMTNAHSMIPPNFRLQFLTVFKFWHLKWMDVENKSTTNNATHCTPLSNDQNIEE